MIEVRQIDAAHKADINLPNHPFPLFGRMIPRYDGAHWSYTTQRFEQETSMCFPDEDYDYDAMADTTTFLGAYDGEVCIGLAILQRAFFKYMYLYDLKIDPAYRRQGVGRLLMDAARKAARDAGYRGLYTQGQDNNLGACLFYIGAGFYIGGLDTNVYRGTKQEGKADIIFYCEC